MSDNTFETFAAELDAVMSDGWARVPAREREGISVFALRRAGSRTAQVVTNTGLYPDWSWSTYDQGSPLGASVTGSAADAVRQAEDALQRPR